MWQQLKLFLLKVVEYYLNLDESVPKVPTAMTMTVLIGAYMYLKET